MRLVCFSLIVTACYRSAPAPAPAPVEPFVVTRAMQRPPDGSGYIAARVLRTWSTQEGTIAEVDRGDEHGVGFDWDARLIDAAGTPIDDRTDGRVVRLKSQRTLASLPHAPDQVKRVGWVRLQRPPMSIAKGPWPPAPSPPPSAVPTTLTGRIIRREIAGPDLVLGVGIGAHQGVTRGMTARVLDANHRPVSSSASIVRVDARYTVVRVVHGASLPLSSGDYVEITP